MAPYKETIITKKYFSIGEAREQIQNLSGYKINSSALRFWEGDLDLNIKHGKNGRLYTSEDIELFRIIVTLIEKYGMGIGTVRTLIRNPQLRARLVTFLLHENFLFLNKYAHASCTCK